MLSPCNVELDVTGLAMLIWYLLTRHLFGQNIKGHVCSYLKKNRDINTLKTDGSSKTHEELGHCLPNINTDLR